MTRKLTLADLDPADRRLVETACEESAHAYAPYSGFAVGAAVRTRSGKIYAGTNLENASYGLTICAEVAAIVAANAAGDFDVDTIAIAGHKFTSPQNAGQLVTPCGRCRQIICEAAQLADTDVRVLSCNGQLSEIMESNISELLPAGFGPAKLSVAKAWPAMQQILYEAVKRLRGGKSR